MRIRVLKIDWKIVVNYIVYTGADIWYRAALTRNRYRARQSSRCLNRRAINRRVLINSTLINYGQRNTFVESFRRSDPLINNCRCTFAIRSFTRHCSISAFFNYFTNQRYLISKLREGIKLTGTTLLRFRPCTRGCCGPRGYFCGTETTISLADVRKIDRFLLSQQILTVVGFGSGVFL